MCNYSLTLVHHGPAHQPDRHTAVVLPQHVAVADSGVHRGPGHSRYLALKLPEPELHNVDTIYQLDLVLPGQVTLFAWSQ